jgi:hypothetical protein
MKRASRIAGLLLGFSSFVTPVFAEELGGLEDGVATIYSLETLFSNIVTVITSLAAVALFVMFVVSGFTFLFSGGDQKKLEQAKGTFTNAIIGLVVIVTAFLILRVIQAFTGVGEGILQFGIPSL